MLAVCIPFRAGASELSGCIDRGVVNKQFAEHLAAAYGLNSEKYGLILEPILAPMADEIAAAANLDGGMRALDLAAHGVDRSHARSPDATFHRCRPSDRYSKESERKVWWAHPFCRW